MAKLPGVLLALTGSVGFAVGTIFLKRFPIQLPGATSATWQIAIGSVPIALAGTLLEHPHIAALSSAGWFALGYMILVGHCIPMPPGLARSSACRPRSRRSALCWCR